MTATAKDTFQEIIALTDKTTELMEAFGAFPPADQETVLGDAFKTAIAKLGEDDEVPITLVRCAEMLVGVMTENVVKILVQGLAHVNPTVRLLSGDAVTHIAEENMELLKPAIDDVLAEGSRAAEEMPFILSELDEPEVFGILERFLAHESGEVVASAIEVLIEMDDPQAITAIEKLTKDSREVTVDEEMGSAEKTTVGQLAKDALEIFQEEE
jgi:HEAT repeat protein